MENLFLKAARIESVKTETENGQVALSTTFNACLDFYATVGALRSDSGRAITLFEKAYKENPLVATKILFYLRDVREGLGERDLFRDLCYYAAKNHSESIKENIQYIPEYGRFDDWYCLIDTSLEETMWGYMSEQFDQDNLALTSDLDQPVSLLAKWIKTPDASSKNTRKLGILTAKKLGYSVYEFKRILKKLRKHLNIVEREMSANNWSDIEYSIIPSRAMLKHSAAFSRHDNDRFEAFAKKASSGEVKVNSSNLYPYDLLEKLFVVNWNGIHFTSDQSTIDITNAQWLQQPDYIEKDVNAIVMADTSGSMSGRPLYTAIGLAVYFAQRNRGAFHNLWMSFSESPKFHTIEENSSLYAILKSMDMSDWEYDTNIEKAFELILNICVENEIPEEDVPKSLIIISDMEFNSCVRYTHPNELFYENMEKRFLEKGYQIPNVVFWNVNSRSSVFHANCNQRGVQLASGQSTAIFKNVMDAVGTTPVEAMLNTINSDRYAPITLSE